MTDLAAAASEAPDFSRKWVVLGGRVLLLVLLLLGWELSARRFGSIFFAPPLEVALRIVSLAQSGKLLEDVAATLRVSALGFAIACVAGALLPFLLRRSPRVTAAVEPYIMASMGFQTCAAPWLILWFARRPASLVVTLVVFTSSFTFAGIRAVHRRLIDRRAPPARRTELREII
jgi:NitT/TauT family transport system permease protein